MRGINAAQSYEKREKIIFSDETIIGALAKYISTPNKDFQPMNANFGILPELEERIYEEYSSTLAGMRFSSYIWNMRRLTRKTAKEFAKTVRTDYARLEKEGVLDREKLDTEAYGLVRQLPVKHPMIYLDIRPIYESRGKMLRFGSNTVRRISPMHRQQERAMKNLDELNFLMDEIMQELDNYEEKNEVKNEK